jgi:hypothetical protein
MVRRGRIRRGRVVARTLVFCAVTLAVIALAPVIVLVGEPLRRHYLRRLSRPPWRVVARVVIANPALIALTAPSRWVIDRVGDLRAGGSGGRGFGRFGRRGGQSGGDWPPSAGVREPRRPKPDLPAGAIALAEPRQQHRAIPILKALPPSLSEPVRRVGSRLGRMAPVLRLRVSGWHLGQ